MNQDKPRRAIYAGSFDPPTFGHLWMIQEAQRLFDELLVAVGTNPDKQTTYTMEEKVQMLKDITAQFDNVKVVTFTDTYLVNYAESMGVDYIIRGIRTAQDYEYEKSMRHINADIHPDITTVFLMPPREFAEVSSTMVKGLVGPSNWKKLIRRYVPEPVYRKIVDDWNRDHPNEK